jgi:phosphoserine phosphatase
LYRHFQSINLNPIIFKAGIIPVNMNTRPPVWPISNIVIFDCDSTLSAIEGIDELARMTGHEYDVAMLTKRAMEGDVPLESVYGHRLVTVNPTQEQVREIAKQYRKNMIADARDVIFALQTLGTEVFIVSGGLIEPVRDFGVWLGVDRTHIFAVDMEYDQLSGEWWRYWELPGGHNPRANYLAVEANPLTGTRGKNQIVTRIREKHPGRAMLVGDGLSDLETAPDVDLFVGFGGAVYRKRIAEESPVYIHAPSLAPLLPLALGQLGNTPRFARLWAEGLQRVYTGQVTFHDEETKEVFISALRRNHVGNGQ